MGIFQRISDSIARFMYGRNGLDKLGLATLWIGLGLNLLSAFVSQRFVVAGNLLYSVSFALEVLTLFRLFSKNLEKRREENARFLGFWSRVKGSSNGALARHNDKEHKYFTCKSCKTICRVPVGKGNIIITCPKCGAEIKAKT